MSPDTAINFLENEFLIATTWNQNWREILRSKVSVGVIARKKSSEAFYARAAREQADVLGCECMVVPGHHAGFNTEAEEFAPSLGEMIGRLERKRGEAEME